MAPESRAQDDEDWAEGVDLSRIPEAADRPVDFLTDIKALIEKHCLSCHGEKNPKSSYQMTSRDLVIESGDYGGNVVVGNGLQSPLLHFLAHAVEEMEMPPIGKGDAMGRDDVAVFRAWIDQELPWDEDPSVTVTTSLGVTGRIWSVDGNKNQFRQLHGFREDDSLGISSFSLYHPDGKGGAWYTEGSVWTHPEEFKVLLGYEQPKGPWFQSGVEQWLTFDTTTGGYQRGFTPSTFTAPGRFDRRHQHFWFESGINQDDGPDIYIGYDYRGIDGTKSLLSFGEAADDINGNFTLRAMRPSQKLQNNEQHRLTLRIGTDFSEDFAWEDQADIDWVRVDETISQFGSFTQGVVDPEQRIDRDITWDSLRGSNSIRMQKQLPKQWLLTAGHSFSLMEGQSVFAENTVIFNNNFAFQGPVGQGIVLNQHSQLGNLNLHGGTWDNGLSLTAGLQFDWLTQNGAGFVVPFPGAAPQNLDTGWDQFRLSEFLTVQYTKIPRQVFYASSQFRQTRYDQSEFLDTQVNRLTEASQHRQQYTAGWRYRPISQVGIHVRARYTNDSVSYDNPIDERFGGPGTGYSAFLRNREDNLFDVEGRVSWSPASDWSLETHYQWSTSQIDVATDPANDFNGDLISPGGSVNSADFDLHSSGMNIAWIPANGWTGMVHGSATYWDLSAFANGFPGVSPYQGWTWWAGTRWGRILSPKADISAAYDFSAANFQDGDGNFAFADGLQYAWQRASLRLQYRIRPELRTFAEYSFSIWDQPSLGGSQDFEAHGVYVGLNWSLAVVRNPTNPQN